MSHWGGGVYYILVASLLLVNIGGYFWTLILEK